MLTAYIQLATAQIERQMVFLYIKKINRSIQNAPYQSKNIYDIQCPPDVYKRNGQICNDGNGFCYNGECPKLNRQCSILWGENSKASESICYKQFNAQGTIRGNCGMDTNGQHLKCSEE